MQFMCQVALRVSKSHLSVQKNQIHMFWSSSSKHENPETSCYQKENLREGRRVENYCIQHNDNIFCAHNINCDVIYLHFSKYRKQIAASPDSIES